MSTAKKNTNDDSSWALFVDDATAATTEIEEGLLALEGNPEDAEQLNALFRGLHTLKGSSGFVGLAALSKLAHEAENLVGRVRERELSLTSAMVDTLLETLDMLRRIVDESRDGPVDSHDALTAPLRDSLARLSTADGIEKADTEGLLLASTEFGVALEGCLPGTRVHPGLVEHARELWETGETLGLPGFTRHAAALLAALQAGQTRSIRLHWHLAHKKAEEAAAGRVVFIDGEFDDAPGDDEGAVRVFLECAALLLSPLVHELRLSEDSAGPNELSAVVDELASMCETMRDHALAELATSVHDEPDDAESTARRVMAALVDVQNDWVQRTGATDSDALGLASLSAGVWDGETTPYAPEPSVEEQAATTREEMGPMPSTPRKAANGAPRTKFLRIEAAKVEQLMALAGELGLAAGAVFNDAEVAGLEREELRSNIERVEGLIRELQDTSAGFALVPLNSVFSRMKRLTRDLMRQTGKKFNLVTRGGDTEIDKVWVDALVDPLIHLLRNAADHGIESVEDRIAAGKPEVARILLRAQHHGDNVTITIEDDGAGMNREAILRRAVERGLVSPQDADEMSDPDVWELVFAPGFTTAETVSDLSGRGMGMDVVRDTVQAHRGRINVASESGRGTRITLQVPLTLAFLDGMVIRVGRWLYVLPVTSVTRVFRVEESERVRVKSGIVDLVRVGEDLVPCVELEALFSGNEPGDVVGRLVVVVHAPRGKMAIPIDELVGQEQVTMFPLTGFLSKIRGGTACGLLRSGEVAIALDCERLHGHAL